MTGADARGRARGIVAALAVTQTIGYGTLYYAFAVVLGPLAADLDTSATAVTGAFTCSVLTGAVLALPVGRWLDAHGGRGLMTLGSSAGTLLLVAWAGVRSVEQLYLVQIGIGAATAASLYEAAFAVVVAWSSPRRRSGALLAVTVVAGFASTIFLPLTGWLVAQHGWRTALLVLAAVQATTVPLHALVVRRPPRPAARSPAVAAAPGLRASIDRRFWLLAAGFTAHTAATSAMTVHLVTALVSFGHPAAFAATIAGLLGMLSVAGRLVTTGLHRRFPIATVTAAVFAVQAAAAAALPLAGRSPAGAAGAVVGFGLGFGVATIARPLVLAEHYDVRRFATLAGVLTVPMTVAKAAAPLLAAVLAATAGGYRPVLAAVAACCLVAAVAVAVAGGVDIRQKAQQDLTQ